MRATIEACDSYVLKAKSLNRTKLPVGKYVSGEIEFGDGFKLRVTVDTRSEESAHFQFTNAALRRAVKSLIAFLLR